MNQELNIPEKNSSRHVPDTVIGGIGIDSLRRQILKDFKGVIVLVLISGFLGVSLNLIRSDSLPLVYQSKEERLLNETQEMKASMPETETEDLFSVAQDIPIPEVDLDQTKEMIASGLALVIDARPSVFYEEGHIPGAINLPRESFKAAYAKLQSQLESSREKALIIYCSGATCKDSHLVAGALKMMGFPSVFVYREGWEEWSISGERSAGL